MVKDCNFTVSSLMDAIHHKYEIDNTRYERLCFIYRSYMIQTKKGTKEKVVKPFNVQIEKSSKDLLKDRTIAYPNPDGSPSILHRSLTLKDIHLRVNVPNATVVEKDLSCD